MADVIVVMSAGRVEQMGRHGISIITPSTVSLHLS